jgi:hypothetical protein
MKRSKLLFVLIASGVLLGSLSAIYAGEKDTKNAGKARAATKDTEEPDLIEISEEKFACNDEVISIGGIKAKGWYKLNDNGYYEMKKDSTSPPLAIRGKTIRWWCGKAQEDWQADTGAEYIVVSRGKGGAGTVIYYKTKK